MSTSATVSLPGNPVMQNTTRVSSIDLLRGLIMILMALDHVRDYFHADALIYEPTDLEHTNVLLFFTRFITHYCAPVFMFLSGTSAYLVGQRKGKKALATFLFTRGLWLIFLELTVVNFGWYFSFPFPSVDFLVIWALGFSMIVLAGLIYLPLPLIIALSLVMIFGHNLLDNIHVPGEGASAIAWSLFHESRLFMFKPTVFVGYPVIPWIGVMALGYATGRLYQADWTATRRKKLLVLSGLFSILIFIALRYSNVYGDPAPWAHQSSRSFTILSFLNVSKYPPSLLYLLITLGPALLLLAWSENIQSGLAEKIKVIGRVPMFYYLVHLYLIHIAALFATYLCGHTASDMILDGWISFQPQLKGYGFPLGVAYGVWAVLIVILYFLCKWYDRYKRSHRQWWLSYL